MTAKKILLPPLIPLALLLILCAWVFFSETTGEVRMIDGRPDNAPTRAALILALLSPVAYLFFGVFNLVDAASDRLNIRAAWICTSLLVCAFGILLSFPFYAPDVDSSRFTGVAIAFGVSIASIAPMSVFRRFAIKTQKKKPNNAQMATPRNPSD
jgi:hypothetical protein